MTSTCRRMDSTLINSNIRKLTRNDVIYLVAKNVVCISAELLIPLPAEWGVFLEKGCKLTDIDSRQSLGYQPPLPPKKGATARDHRTAELIGVCLAVREQVSHYDNIRSTKEYALLERVIWEQTEEDEQGNLRMLSKVRSGSLQSPYDPDAQYRKKNKQECWGYSGQIVEDRDGEKGVSLISFFDMKGSLHPDTAFAKEYIETWVPHDGMRLCADGGYYSHEISELAQSKGISLCFTNMTGRRENPDKLRASTFVRDKRTKEITRCVANKEPENSQYKPGRKPGSGTSVAYFNGEDCKKCPFADQCIGKLNKTGGRTIRLTDRTYSAAEQRDQLEETKYREAGNSRAAIEGVCSALKNAYGARRLKVRGERRARLTMFAKCVAYNTSQVSEYIVKFIRIRRREVIS
ncbi:transposase [Pasteuria penetrans]|nr:transposase [Pasteuria penetrans]